MKFTDCIEIVGNRPKVFNGEKRYISTGAIDIDYIDEDKVEIITYDERPSRADLSVCSGDVIFAKMAGTRKNIVIDEKTEENIYSTGFFAVRGKAKIISAKCLYYLVGSELFLKQKDKHSSGATQRAITNKGLENINISVPKLSEQERIVSQLDCVASIIKKRKEELRLLDDLIKARFVELFGDPVLNPYGYDKVALSDLADIKIGPFGSILHKEDYIEGGHPLLNPSHIVDGKVSPDDKLTISDEKYEELSAYQLKTGDVVMGRRGEMGRCAVVHEEGFLCGTGNILIRTKGEVTADYIQKIISFPSFKKTIEDMAVGQTMPNLNVPIVSSFQIIKPPMEVQDSYYAFVTQVDKSKFIDTNIIPKGGFYYGNKFFIS